jgi:hypothetical protein
VGLRCRLAQLSHGQGDQLGPQGSTGVLGERELVAAGPAPAHVTGDLAIGTRGQGCRALALQELDGGPAGGIQVLTGQLTLPTALGEG